MNLSFASVWKKKAETLLRAPKEFKSSALLDGDVSVLEADPCSTYSAFQVWAFERTLVWCKPTDFIKIHDFFLK